MRPLQAVARGGRSAVGVAVAALLLGACGGGDPAAEPADPSSAGTEAPAGTPTPTGGDSVNPVIADDFPDPDVLEVDDVYYAYATEGNLKNVRVARSADLVEWEQLPDALPELPS